MVKKILLALVVVVLLSLLGLGFFFFNSSKKLVADVNTTVNKLNDEAKNKQQNVETTPSKVEEKQEIVTTNATTDFKTYNNEDEGITIDYPSDWEVTPGDGKVMIASFFSPLQSATDEFQESVGIMIQDFSEVGMDLAKFDKQNTEALGQYMENFKITKHEDTEVDGEPGKFLIFTGTYPGQDTPTATVQSYTVFEDYVYVLTYTGKQGDFEKFVTTAQEMFKSFSF
ncbi:MAG: PsbP-related protein [Patescibacteria group bacterium]|nr:PsbP-related protein [Patescibacteria group bacterium]